MKIKLLMLVNYIPHYRLPILFRLGEKFNLTVAHYAKSVVIDENINFEQILLTPIFFMGFKLFKENIYEISRKFDVVISLAEIRVIPNMLLGFRKRNFGLIFWGIGVNASYNKSFDSNSKLDVLRFFLMKNADALLFYSDYPKKKYIEKGFDSKTLFVAHNTVLVEKRIEVPFEKKHFIFVGSLYKQKKIYELLFAYEIYLANTLNILPLVIIGGGEEEENIIAWISAKRLTDKILLKGQINDQKVLKDLYRDAIACISPGQAGLTVLNSMAYGVPFITNKNAITGGEIFNIIHDKNGILYDGNIEKLALIMKSISEDGDFTNTLSLNAQNYYFEERTIEIMLKGFENAIDFVYKKKQ